MTDYNWKITIQGSVHMQWQDIEYQHGQPYQRIKHIGDGAMEFDKHVKEFTEAIRVFQPMKE